MRTTPTNVLIRRVDNLGDMVLVLPVLRELRLHLLHARFTLMVKPEHRGLFYSYADDFRDPLELASLPELDGEYDLVINIEYSFPKDYTPRPIGTQSVLHIGTPNWNRKQHVYRHLLDGLAAHGVPVTRRMPRVKVSPQARKHARTWFAQHPIRPDAFNVMVNPGSGLRKKRWPLASYVAVCAWLINTFDAHIGVLGRGHETETQALYDALPGSNCTLLTDTPIGDIAAIMSKYDLLIGNDSGTSHLAAGLGLPTVTVFGLTSPGLWKPVGRKAVTVFNHTIECICGYEQTETCADPICLTSITPRHVIDGILFSINRHIPRHTATCLDGIEVSPTARFTSTASGVVITDSITEHACRVEHGWEYVMEILEEVRLSKSFAVTQQKFPEDRKLLEFLLLHRVLKYASDHFPASEKWCGDIIKQAED